MGFLQEEIVGANTLDLSEIDDADFKELYVASLMLLAEDSSVDLAHSAVMAVLDTVEIDFTPMTSVRLH